MAKLPKRIIDSTSVTRRPISKGAEKWLGRPIKCLDHGFVYLVDYMGDDAAPATAARVSYGKGTRNVRKDEELIRYLRRHVHTSPFEMVEFKFHCKMPIFVARQWIRHRTASVNEESGRYSKKADEFYIPDPSVMGKQSTLNKQGRESVIDPEHQAIVLRLLQEEAKCQYGKYQQMLNMDLAKELARIPLGLFNYTQWYWKIDLHNLMHFLRLRLDSHAQWEFQQYGQAIARIVKDAAPSSYRAFEDYVLNAMTFSCQELLALGGYEWPMPLSYLEKIIPIYFEDKLEGKEFIAKLKKINFIQEG